MATQAGSTIVRKARTPAPMAAPITRRSTRMLLAGGTVAGAVFAITVLIEAATRHGFSLTRNAASLLELGSWGWVQQVNFLATGALLLAGALGLRRALQGGTGRVWIPRLVAITSIGIAAAGIFRPDPGNGFPPGTPLDATGVTSLHGAGHMVVSTAAFIAMVAFCIIVGRRAASQGQRRLRLASYTVAGISAVSVMTAPAPYGSLTMFCGITLALLWIGAACLQALRAGA